MSQTEINTVLSQSEQNLDQLPYVQILLLITILIFIVVGFAFVKNVEGPPDSCCARPGGVFEYRSEDVDRYNTRQALLNQRFNKRFTPCANYPNAPQYTEDQKYLGSNRLPKYKQPNVSIIDERSGKILINTNDLSIDNTLSCGSELGSYKHIVEKRRKHQERQEHVEKIYKMIKSKQEAGTKIISNPKEENPTDYSVVSTTSSSSRSSDGHLLPRYRSEESLNIFEFWKLQNSGDDTDWIRVPNTPLPNMPVTDV